MNTLCRTLFQVGASQSVGANGGADSSEGSSPVKLDFLMMLNQRHPGMDLEFRQEGNSDKDKMFICEAQVEGRHFGGRGRSKKQAKRDLAMRILREVDKIQIQGMTRLKYNF